MSVNYNDKWQEASNLCKTVLIMLIGGEMIEYAWSVNMEQT